MTIKTDNKQKVIKHKNGSNIFCVPILDQYLVYAPFIDSCALVNTSAVDILAKCLTDPTLENTHPEMNDLVSLFKKQSPEFTLEIDKPLDPIFLGIIPSRRCTMSCVYCGFGASDTDTQCLSPETCVAAIDYFFDKIIRDGKKRCQIHFFGGEPFIEDEIVDISIHHARMVAERTGVHVSFEASTNGFYSESRAKFIGDYVDITVLSLDGFKEFHDKNRPANPQCGSFDVVTRTAKILSNSSTTLNIRCCVTTDSVDSMTDMAHWFCREFNPSSICFETLQENELSHKAGLFPPAPLDFARNYVKAEQVIRAYGVQPVYASIEGSFPRHTFCPVGSDALIIGPDDMINGCYLQKNEWESKGMDLSLGNIGPNGHISVDTSSIGRLRSYVADKPRCIDCLCRYSCAGGCHVHNTYPDSSEEKTDFCRQTRILQVNRLLLIFGMDRWATALIDSREAMSAIAEHPCDSLVKMKNTDE